MVATTPARPGAAEGPSRPAQPPSSPTGRQPRLYAIDALRFIAALAVVLYHFTVRDSIAFGGQPPGEVFPELGPWLMYGVFAPELFFVVSGFAILMTAWGRDVPNVVASRLARVYPSYWIAVILTSALLLWIWEEGKDVSIGQALVNLTLLQSMFEVPHVDGVYWTLWTELRYYLLMVVFVAIGISRRRVLWFCALWPPIGFLTFEMQTPVLRHLLIDQYAPFFAGGMLLYLIYRDGHRLVPWLLMIPNVALAVYTSIPRQYGSVSRNSVFEPDPHMLAVATVACFALVALLTLTRLRNWRWRFAVTLGALTYPLYLIHEFWGWWVISLVYPHTERWPALGAGVAAVLILATAIWHIEKRVSPRMRRRLERGLRLGRRRDDGQAPNEESRVPAPAASVATPRSPA